jgi:site-specific recombinase XerD
MRQIENEKEIIDSFLNQIKITTRSIMNKTLNHYSRILTDFWLEYAHKRAIPLYSFKRDIIRDIMLELRTKYKATTIRNYFAILSSYFQFCIEEEIIEHNPLIKMKLPKKEQRELIYLKEEEVKELNKKLLDFKMDSDYLQNFFIFFIPIILGLRVSETSNLSINDLKEDGVHIIGKGNKERIVFIPNDNRFKEILKNYLIERELKIKRIIQEKPQKSLSIENTLSFFINNRGTQLSIRDIQRRIAQMRNKLNLNPHLSPHKLRHTYASILISKGFDIFFIQKLLGHSNIATTEIYLHCNIERLKNRMQTEQPFSFE